MLAAAELSSLFQKYNTRAEGLSQSEAELNLKQHGLNIIDGKHRKAPIILFLEEFKDLMVIILIVAAVLAIIAGETRDAIVILFIVVLNALIGFLQKFKAEKAIEALRKLVAPKARVVRNGIQKELEAKYVVPGDILIISEGDSITADAILFEVNELETQESALTGESVPVRKLDYDIESTKGTEAEKENMIFMGTIVTQGSGKAIVIGTGMHTEMGKIAKLTTETKKDLSPLEKELNRIGVFVGKIALAISGVLLIEGLVLQKKEFAETLLFATSVAVAAVPEGLPATVTIALAIGVQRLAKKNAIVKQLSSVETLGSTTVICSDKTGTLTKNEMTVKEMYFDEYEVSVRGVGYNPLGSIHIERDNKHCVTIGHENGMYEDYEHQRKDLQNLEKNHNDIYASLEPFMLTASLCNNADLIKDETKNWKILGDPTEGALLTLAEKAGFTLEKLPSLFEKIHELPFDSKRKRMSVIMKNKETSQYLVFTKGAPDTILEVCTQNIYRTKVVKLDGTAKEKFLQLNEGMAKRALRCLGFAYREISAKEVIQLQQEKNFTKEIIEKDLIFLGLVGMIDPPRPEVKAAVETAHKAGIRTYIITGDHGLTAEAIASQLSLITEKRKHIILTGQDLNDITDEKLCIHLSNKNLDIIFARVSPEHKLRIVTLLKEIGEVVAVTGDGVNDAPALKRADIGIAMGITGTDVSKEASNMVLADDSYSTIVTAIQEGRTIYENLKKFVFYVFSCNIGELFTVFATIVMGLPAALSAILILCIDLGTDVLPAVALGIDPSDNDTMNKKPRKHQEKIMNKTFVIRYVYLGIVMGLIIMSIYILTLYRYGWHWGSPLNNESFTYLKASSSAFVLLVIIQMMNTFNARSESKSIFRIGFFSNMYLLGAIAISLLITFAIVELPFFQTYIHTTSLNTLDWAIICGASLIVIVVEELRKFIQKPRATRITRTATTG